MRPAITVRSCLLCRLLMLALIFCAPAAHAFKKPTADLPGSADHPELGRIPGAKITRYEQRRFGVVHFPLSMGRRGIEQTGKAEGAIWKIEYYLPDNIAPDGAIAIYRRNLQKKGFQILLDHDDSRGYISMSRERRKVRERFKPLTRPIFILVAKGKLRGRLAAVIVYAYTVRTTWGKRHWVRLRIVESKPLDAGLKVIGAKQMASEIGSKGRIALYGILFDHDSDKIKPESTKTLSEIAKYLRNKPEVRLYVVGHTDNTGTYEYNMNLSRRRAAAVVRALTSQHGIAANRLKAVGVGPVAPVTSNNDEQGRARNRRVELVAQ